MIRLFHISDLHFGAEDLGALGWFEDLVATERPDAVLCTGDLTMRARDSEFAAAVAWLRRLAVPLTVNPGNHDLPDANLWERFRRPYARYLAALAELTLGIALPDLAIVPLKTTARFQWRTNWSKGHVSAGALASALSGLSAVGPDRLRLVTCHHPLVEGDTRMTAATAGGPAALRALAEAGADAVLSGHVHDPFDRAYEHAGRTVRLIGAGTFSERTRLSPPSFNELGIEDGRLRVVEHTMSAAPDEPLPVEPLPDPAG